MSEPETEDTTEDVVVIEDRGDTAMAKRKPQPSRDPEYDEPPTHCGAYL
jgi:hypothetical protein